MRARRPILSIVLLGSCCAHTCVAQGGAVAVGKHIEISSAPVTKSKPAVHTHDTALAEHALSESYGLGLELPIEDRALHLISLCSVTAEMEFLPARRREWLEELYRLGGELDGPLRSRAQNAATRYMAPMDPTRALQMFDGLEAPANSEPDPRPWIARELFAKMLEQQGTTAIPALTARARKLGENGA